LRLIVFSLAFYCVCSMLFASIRVVFSYCIGWDIGGALAAFDTAFPLEIPTGQRAWSDVGMHLVLRLTIVWNATAGFLYFVKQDLRPAMEPGV
jgi:hypothetical protein